MKSNLRKETPARKAARILIGIPIEELQHKNGIDWDYLFSWAVLSLLLLVALAASFLLLFPSNAHANNKIIVKGYSNEEICNAIEKAENGKNKNPKYPYGIRSVKCKSKQDCRKVCINTVRNNRKRYQQDENYGKITFIEFLGSRFCPTKGRNLSIAENKLNKNWIKNVNFFLKGAEDHV